MDKKGVTPVVATVLLISIAVALAVIIFVWAIAFNKEVITKNGQNIDSFCDRVDLRATLNGNNIEINNKGSIPVDNVKILDKDGGSEVARDCDESGLLPIGRTVTLSKASCKVAGTPIKVIPVLKGDSKDYQCKKGFEIA